MKPEDVTQPDKVAVCLGNLEGLTNNFGCRADLEDLANRMSCMHRTLLQSFTGGFVVPFVRTLARLYREGKYDARSKAACEACAAMCEALEKKYDIKADDPLRFACI